MMWEQTWLERKMAVDLCQVEMQVLSDSFASGQAPDFHLCCLARYSVQTLPEPAPGWQPTTTAEKPSFSRKSWPYSTPQSTGCELHTTHPDLKTLVCSFLSASAFGIQPNGVRC